MKEKKERSYLCPFCNIELELTEINLYDENGSCFDILSCPNCDHEEHIYKEGYE